MSETENRNAALAKEIATGISKAHKLTDEEAGMIEKMFESSNPAGQSWDSITGRIAQRILKEEKKSETDS